MQAGDARSLAAWALDRTLRSKAPADAFLEEAARRLDGRDRRLLHELVLGGLRWLRRLDQVIESAASRPMARIDRALWSTLRIGAYQLLFLDRVPAHAAVDQAVREARRRSHRGGAGFVNAVLRRLATRPSLEAWPVDETHPLRRLAVETSHPDLLVERWVRLFGLSRTQALLRANNRPKPLHLLSFHDRGGRRALAERLAAEGLHTEPSSLSPVGLIVRRGDPLQSEAFRRGDLYLQDEASQAAALVPLPTAGEEILDAAAAPGGKSFTLLAAEPAVRLICADGSMSRTLTLAANMRRLARRRPLVVADAGRAPFRGSFGRVLLDVPCSGTGTLRKHPELKWRSSEAEIARLGRQIRHWLEGVAHLVAHGGLLVFMTCSLEPEENETVMERFLAHHAEFRPCALSERLDGTLQAWVTGPGTWRVLPADDHDGFSVQVLLRTG